MLYAYTHMHHACVCKNNRHICKDKGNICISAQCEIIAKRSVKHRSICHWNLGIFHMYSPDMNAVSTALCRPFLLLSDLTALPNILIHIVGLVIKFEHLSIFIMRPRKNLLVTPHYCSRQQWTSLSVLLTILFNYPPTHVPFFLHIHNPLVIVCIPRSSFTLQIHSVFFFVLLWKKYFYCRNSVLFYSLHTLNLSLISVSSTFSFSWIYVLILGYWTYSIKSTYTEKFSSPTSLSFHHLF